jgi:hypothetical protein
MKKFIGIPAVLGLYIVLFFYGQHVTHIDPEFAPAHGYWQVPLAGLSYFLTHAPDYDHINWLRTLGATMLLIFGCQFLGALLLGLVAAPFVMLFWKQGAETLGCENHMSFGKAWFFATGYLMIAKQVTEEA